MRIAGAILIVFAASTTGYAQLLEQPPLIPPRREVPPRQWFPTEPLDSQLFPRVPPQPQVPADQFLRPPFSGAPVAGRVAQATEQNFPTSRSGPVCLQSVPVDPSSDRGFVIPLPDVRRSLPMQRIEMPPCVTLAPQPTR